MTDNLETTVLKEPLKKDWKDFIPAYGVFNIVRRLSPQERMGYQMAVFSYQLPAMAGTALAIDYISKLF